MDRSDARPDARVTRGVAALLLAAGCAASPEASSPAAPAAPPLVASEAPEPSALELVRSARQGLRLPLHDARAWQLDDASSTWLAGRSSAEEATLLVRLWSDEQRRNRDKCEASARELRRLPALESMTLLEERAVDVPPGFDTVARVAVREDGKSGLYGVVLAFGGRARRCFGFVYVTHASGPEAERVVGERLARTVESTLSGVELDSRLEAPVGREPFAPAR
jgi:hypothetical protein